MADGDLTQSNKHCTVAGCSRPLRARALCSAHWARWRRYGDATGGVSLGALPLKCEAPGCTRGPHSRWRGGSAYCNKHYLRLLNTGQLDLLPKQLPALVGQCVIEGCSNFRRSGRAKLCEMHYYRKRRTGSTERRGCGPAVQSGGYVLVKQAHPLTQRSGWVYEHRMVAYDAHDGVCPACYWCGKGTSWKACHVDHLNGVKSDNRAANLVVACAGCNRIRGAAWPFLVGMRGEAFAQLMDMLGEARG